MTLRCGGVGAVAIGRCCLHDVIGRLLGGGPRYADVSSSRSEIFGSVLRFTNNL